MLSACSLMIGALSWGGGFGCDKVATKDPGVFVPNLEGTYDLQNVTDTCADQFDTVIDISQVQDSIIWVPTGPTFTNLTGTVDVAGAIKATGASSFGSPFECTGQFVSGLISGVCVAKVDVCETDPVTEVQTCTTNDESCGFSYKRE